ncbi:bifunctional riboflavin kinase/FAD synthetase [Jeotgalibacillus haloalkalitolerans]|uniref:Riboflavin biosynthesis protein n=1 Tax=Jeotgalibacillus haloalkalitolerans TaxID=3104292 RepID=A0ABU5KLZ6_9BACL|nr:bifunctional riboflavin kinase/FAD synthetase [Jeotgalibacillus sp. HH7-29]MDZ5711766.1 bifunctional riboflavin kinase/FAD synthetase [Jeotgalibacillus sp. HH7-29]
MKVYTLHHPHEMKQEDFPPISIALGFFDGVHLGHRKVIQKAIDYAKENGIKSAVMTFDPHPSVVLSAKKSSVQYLSSLDQKIKKIEALGVDYLLVVRFTSAFASLEPQEFVDQYLIGLNAVHVTAGFDYSYGKFGRGKMETLPFHARGKFTSTTVEKQTDENEKISSTRIRELLSQGQPGKAARLLGMPHETEGLVVHGEKRGRKIGFPTANIDIENGLLIPSPGVYAVKMNVNHTWYDGVCNVGYKPTFNDPDQAQLSVEVHLFEFNDSIYGENVRVQWIERIRSEKKFNGIDELIAQIEKDKDSAIEILKR